MVQILYLNKKFSILYAIILLLISQSFILAQTGTLRGTVADKSTKEILPGANVVVQGTSLGAATDLDGKFIIKNVPAGNQTLNISYIGYESMTVKVNVPENKTLEDNYFLDYKSIEGKTVTITAQAEGQLSAINQQLTSNTISNVVSKDRIRELPDVNAAETIGRLPGVSIERYGGEATKVSIRGLSPKYNLITVNGVRLPSTGQDDRSVDLSLISSNMLDGIVLKKANTPDMDADALGGTVDLKLKEAPKGFKFNLSLQGGHNALQGSYSNYNVTGSLSNRLFNNHLGIIANFNFDSYDRSADKFSADYHRTGQLSQGISPQKLYLREEIVNRKRDGASIVLDYLLSNGKISANTFYNSLKSDGLYHINIMSLTAPGESNRHYYDLEDRGGTTSIWTGALGIEQDFGWIYYDFNIARTSTNTKNPNEHTWRFNQEAGAFTQTEFLPGTDPRIVPQYATNDTFLTRLAEVWIWNTNRDENESSLQFNFKLPVSISKDINGYIKTGAKFRWLDRKNDVEYYGRHGLQYGGGGNQMLDVLDRTIPEWGIGDLVDEYGWLPISIFLTSYYRYDFLNKEYPLGFTYNQEMMERVTKVLDDSGYVLRYSINSLGNDYDGIERYQAGYIMGEFNIGNYFTFIPGIRYEKEYTKYHGWSFREITPNNTQGPPADLTKLTAVRNHNFWLPMVHLIIDPFEWMRVRLAYTETLTRPDFTQFAPIARINSGQDYVRATNSLLRPAESHNYDVALSIYENNIGLFSVTGFYKNIKDLIFQTNYKLLRGIEIPEGANIPESWKASAPSTDLFINNPDPATYKGFELEWQTHFWYLPSILSGIVLNVNYTRIFSEINKWLPNIQRDSLIIPRPPVYSYKVVDSSRTARMPDQPAYIWNVTLGYDVGGFSIRLSYLFQTDKVSYIDSDPVLDTYTGAYARWDLAIQQQLDEGLQVFLNFNNLNSRPDRSFRGDALVTPTYIEYYGLTMDFGFRYKL